MLEEKVLELVSLAKNNLHECLSTTEYFSLEDAILSDYVEFLKLGIEECLITENNIEIFKIKEVVFNPNGNAYASWCFGTLTLQPRFFLERTRDEQRNVLFHELIHSLMEEFLVMSPYARNFSNFCLRISSYIPSSELDSLFETFKDLIELDGYYTKNVANLARDVTTFINEVTTQNLAEILANKTSSRKRSPYRRVESKILTEDTILESNFVTYPEYQQIFNTFLRTINGLGNIQDDEELFFKYFEMLRKGVIWQQIIGTYSESNQLPELFKYLTMMTLLKLIKDSSMGIDVTYEGDKELLTGMLNSMCKNMEVLRNTSELKKYPYEEYPPPPPIKISFGVK